MKHDRTSVSTWRRAVAPLIVGLAVLASCGDDDDGGSSSPTTVASTAAPSTTEAPSSAPTTEGSSATTGQPATTAGADPYAPQPLATQQTITFAWSGPFEPFSPVVVALAKGEFEKENLNVEVVTARGADLLLLLDKAEADIGLSGVTAGLFNAIAAGSTTRWVAPGLYILPGADGFYIRSEFFDSAGNLDVEKFRGGTVATAGGGKGAPTAVFIEDKLNSEGLSLNDFTVTAGISVDNITALETGAIKAGWLSSPQNIEATESGLAKLYVEIPPKTALAAYQVGGHVFTEKREAGEAFFRAIQRTIDTYLLGDYHANEEVVEILAEANGIDPSVITGQPPAYEWEADLDFDTSIITKLQEGWIDFGEILTYDTPLPIDQVVDQSLVPGLG